MRYCFLETVYTAPSVDTYEIIQCDRSPLFANITLQRVPLAEMQNMVANPNLICNFSFDDGFFKCAPNVKRLPLNNLIDTSGTQITEVHEADSGLLGLLFEGALNNFCLLGKDSVDSLVENGADCLTNATDIVPFTNIKFGQTTMSVYAQVIGADEIYNLMLVTLVNGVLRLTPFYFITEQAASVKTLGCQLVKEISVNGKPMLLWHSGMLSIYNEGDIISENLINKAACTSARQRAVVETLNDYLEHCWKFLNANEAEKKLSWVGGNKSYHSQYGVTFKSSVGKLSVSEREVVINTVLEEFSLKCNTVQELNILLREYAWSPLMKFVAKNFFLAVTGEFTDTTEMIKRVQSVRDYAMKDLFFSDLFLYRIRTKSYVMHIHITDPMRPIICGGNEVETTFIQEGFFYGDFGLED